MVVGVCSVEVEWSKKSGHSEANGSCSVLVEKTAGADVWAVVSGGSVVDAGTSVSAGGISGGGRMNSGGASSGVPGRKSDNPPPDGCKSDNPPATSGFGCESVNAAVGGCASENAALGGGTCCCATEEVGQ